MVLISKRAFFFYLFPCDDHSNLERLLSLFREDPEQAKLVIPALKYSRDLEIKKRLEMYISLEPPHVHAGKIDVLQYHGAFDPEKHGTHNPESPEIVRATTLKASVLDGIRIDSKAASQMLATEEIAVFEMLILTLLLNRYDDSLLQCRKRINLEPEGIVNLPLTLSYACGAIDFHSLVKSLSQESCKISAIRSLGMLGLPEGVYVLLRLMQTEDWKIQKTIIESLELITGAELPLPPIDIKEGPEGKEYEVEVITEWPYTWAMWWHKNFRSFKEGTRYRRGNRYTLESSIQEMAYPLGHHWSRQGSYYELRIRSGAFVTHFEADWYVNDQLNAIQKWQEWWEENKNGFDKSQWLFNGKTA